MKKLLCLLLSLSLLLCGCGGSASSVEPVEPEFTEEELFLQKAYWYLQSDEKEIFSWENGTLEDYCAEESREIISPKGRLNIQGMQLRRVYYPFNYITEDGYQMVSLYFDVTGDFVGTDYSMLINGAETLQLGGPWCGDLDYWLFPEKREVSLEESQTFAFVLRNTGNQAQGFDAYSPSIMAVECYQNGQSHAVGLASASQYIMLEPGEVFVETETLTPADWNEVGWMPFVPGECTAVCYVPLTHRKGNITITLSKTATFQITE